MKRVWLATLFLAMGCLATSAGAAAVPSTINYQGYLSGTGGDPLPDGDYDLTFRIFNVLTGGTALWTEARTGANDVTLVNGRFNVELGAISTFAAAGLNFTEQYYLEIQLTGQAAFEPRLAFNAVPYALHAQNLGTKPLPGGAVVGTTDAQTLSAKTLTAPDINGGTIDNTAIGSTTPAAGNFTTLSASGDLTVAGTILGRTTIADTVKTANYTLTANDDIIQVDTSGGPVTVTLPTASGNAGRTYAVKLQTAGQAMTIATAGAETINGETDLVLDEAGQAVRLVSDGANWQGVGEVGNVFFGRRDTADQDSGAVVTDRDRVILHDLIVDGSQCVGLDCQVGRDFAFDTLILQENNIRLNFRDTSTSASFPTTDWRITINDATDGGRNYFAIDNADSGKTGLVVEAGGNVGIATDNAPLGRLDVQTVHSSGSGTVSTVAIAGTGTISSTGTTVTGTGTAFTTELVVGTEITADGETRTVTVISSETQIQVNFAWTSDLTNQAFTIPGTEVTGTDTTFQSELAVNDTLFVDGVSKQITAINSDTSLTVNSAYLGFFSTSPFAYTNAAAQSATGFIVTVDGKVGIGTATPDEKFEIEFAPGVDIEIGRGTTDPDVTFIALRSPNGTKYYVTVDDAGNLTASTVKP